MNRSVFFAKIRPAFGGRLTSSQVDGMDRIIDYWEQHYKSMTLNQFAYLLATIKWETANHMTPVREGGGEAYLRRKAYYPWVGEGLVQVTWKRNAEKFGAKKPGDLMSWPIALRAAFEGSAKGLFTGKSLSDYINSSRTDFINARRVINGTDKAQTIASSARSFQTALVAAKEAKPEAKEDQTLFDDIADVIDWTRHPEEPPQQVPPPSTHRDDALHTFLVPAIIAFIGALASADWNTAFDNPQASILVILTGAAAAAYQAAAPWWLRAVWRPKLV